MGRSDGEFQPFVALLLKLAAHELTETNEVRTREPGVRGKKK